MHLLSETQSCVCSGHRAPVRRGEEREGEEVYVQGLCYMLSHLAHMESSAEAGMSVL